LFVNKLRVQGLGLSTSPPKSPSPGGEGDFWYPGGEGVNKVISKFSLQI